MGYPCGVWGTFLITTDDLYFRTDTSFQILESLLHQM